MRILVICCLLEPLVVAATVDPAPFDAALRAHVTDGRVDYDGLAADARFAAYLAALADAQTNGIDEPRERLALLLNAYNAFAIQGVIAHRPLTSVAEVAGFFDQETHRLGGEEITLDQLVNHAIRKLGDPRVHAALVPATRGGPPLRAEAYVAEKLDSQLDDQCRRWLNDRSKNWIDRQARELHLSRVFDWYKDDFEPLGGGPGFLLKYLQDEADRAWLTQGDYRIVYERYDWRLNGR